MNILDMIHRENEAYTTDIKYDMQSWRNLEYNDISLALSKTLLMYREMRDISQQILAKELGCSKKYIERLENCKIDDIGFRLLIDLWTRLSTPDFNFGDILIKEIHKVVLKNYKQFCKRRWQ